MKNISPKDTDLSLSAIGFGTAAFGLRESLDGENADRILEGYVAGGGNLIDTAHVYSDWIPGEKSRSERVVGDWIRRRGGHSDVVIMSKCCHPNPATMDVSRLSEKDLIEDVNGSLEKLGVDCIDIYVYHRDDESRPVAELIEQMENIRRQGKIRYYACSNWHTDRMRQAEKYCEEKGYRGFILNQAMYNIGTAGMAPPSDKTIVVCDKEMLDYHKNSKTLLVPFSGGCSGFFHRLKSMGADALRKSGYYSERNLKIAEGLFKLCEDKQCSITAGLMGFFSTADFDMLPLSSAEDMEQLDCIVEALKQDFTKEDFAFCRF